MAHLVVLLLVSSGVINVAHGYANDIVGFYFLATLQFIAACVVAEMDMRRLDLTNPGWDRRKSDTHV
jgi:hypothetical protein